MTYRFDFVRLHIGRKPCSLLSVSHVSQTEGCVGANRESTNSDLYVLKVYDVGLLSAVYPERFIVL